MSLSVQSTHRNIKVSDYKIIFLLGLFLFVCLFVVGFCLLWGFLVGFCLLLWGFFYPSLNYFTMFII